MIKLAQLLTEKTGDSYKYGCVMLYAKFPMEKLHKIIRHEDIYHEEGDRTFGLENEPHVTLLYGLHKEVTVQDIKAIIEQYTFGSITVDTISAFENKDYDVLKFDVSGELLFDINEELSKLPHTNDYPDYQPHMTVGYLLPGKAKKYIKLLQDIQVKIAPQYVIFSHANGEKNRLNIKLGKQKNKNYGG